MRAARLIILFVVFHGSVCFGDAESPYSSRVCQTFMVSSSGQIKELGSAFLLKPDFLILSGLRAVAYRPMARIGYRVYLRCPLVSTPIPLDVISDRLKVKRWWGFATFKLDKQVPIRGPTVQLLETVQDIRSLGTDENLNVLTYSISGPSEMRASPQNIWRPASLVANFFWKGLAVNLAKPVESEEPTFGAAVILENDQKYYLVGLLIGAEAQQHDAIMVPVHVGNLSECADLLNGDRNI
jgi:hypothetical protein